MTDHRVFKMPERIPSPAELATAWTKVIEKAVGAMRGMDRATRALSAALGP